MKNLKTAAKIIRQEMINNGTMSKIDARRAKHELKAKQLGFNTAQEAFNALGKTFLETANK